MKNESELNRMIVRSLNRNGFGHKIADTVSYNSHKHSESIMANLFILNLNSLKNLKHSTSLD